MARDHVCLITGANRGIGRALAASILLRPSTTIIATVRDPSHETAKSLSSLPAGVGSKINVLPLDMKKGADAVPPALAAAGIGRLDVIIACAGTTTSFPSAQATEPQDLINDFEVNAVGPFRLFQVCWPLLAQGQTGEKKFVLITSSVGSVAGLESENMPGVAYGASKAAANWIAKKLSVEFKNAGLKVGIIHPGWVQTAMGQTLADAVGFPQPPMTVEDSSRQVLQQIDNLSAETSGKFLSFDGQQLPW